MLIDVCHWPMVPTVLKISPFHTKDPDDRRQPGTVVQTGAWSIKVITDFCSLRREDTLDFNQGQMLEELDGGNTKRCRPLLLSTVAKPGSCSWRSPLSPGGRMLPRRRMRLCERSLRQDKISKPWAISCFPTTLSQRTIYSLKFLHVLLCAPTSYFSISFQGQEVIYSLLFLSFHWPPDPLKMAPLHTHAVWKLREIKFQSLTQWQVRPFLLCWWKKNSSCPARTIKLLSSSLWLAVIEQPCINIIHGDPRGGISHLLSALLHTPEFDKTPRRMIKAAINLSK